MQIGAIDVNSVQVCWNLLPDKWYGHHFSLGLAFRKMPRCRAYSCGSQGGPVEPGCSAACLSREMIELWKQAGELK